MEQIAKKTKKRLPKKLIAPICVVGGLVLLLISLLIARSASAEFSDFITMNITQWWIYAAGHFASLFPFSIFEVFIFLVIISVILLIILLIRLLVKRNFLNFFRAMLITAIVCLAMGNLYTLTAGFMYYRSPISVPQSTEKYNNEMVIDAATVFLDDYNALALSLERDSSGNVISPYSVKEMSILIDKEFKKLNDDYYFDYTPRAKSIGNSWFLTLVNISGITFVPFGEPTVNSQTPPSDLPQTLAHEIAHAKGVMREGDCNFISYYLLLNSEDDYLRYCGYFSSFHYILRAVDSGQHQNENYVEIQKQMNPLIIKEQKNATKFWTEKSSRPGIVGILSKTFENLGEFFNNMYLVLNGADNGTGSYGDQGSNGGIIDTGKTDPDTNLPIYDVVYSSMQKMFFYLYENNF